MHETDLSMLKDPRITAVVLTYNRVRDVLCTLERLSRLPEQPSVIVVDNGSQDGTAEAVIRAWPTAHLIRFSHNIGAAARNAGILFATTPYIALCDDDTWWEERALTKAADLLDRHPRLAIITAKVLIGPDERQDPHSLEMARSPLRPTAGLPGAPVLGFLAGASMVRRSAFLNVGGFDPHLFMGGEETLVALDLAAEGWKIAYIEDLIVHQFPSAKRDPGLRRRLLLRNAIWVAWLRRPLSSAVRQTLRLLRNTVPELPLSSILSILKDTLAGLFWILRHRRVVPPDVESQIQRLDAA